MSSQILFNILRFVFLLFAQGLILSNISLLNGHMHVFLYVLFILLLPFRTASGIVMLLGFLMGFGVDMFYDSPGLHASAALAVAFLRPYFIRQLTPRDDYEVTDRPTIARMGLLWFIRYATPLLFVHAFWLFMVEAFSFYRLGDVFLKAISTAFLTLIVSIVVSYLFSRKKA